MKKIVFFITMLVFLLSVAKGFADSPITTADVYRAYVDLKMVQIAEEEGNLNQDIVDFLADEKNPIDEKMAVINAIFSSGEAFSINESLAQKYVTYVYDESLQELDGKDLLDYEWFVVAYLDAMQNYQDLSTEDTFMENAFLFNEDSLVVNLIYTLYKTNYKIMVGEHSSDDIYNYWNVIMNSISEGVKELDIDFDIRAEALEYYFKYMIMPENTIFNLELEPTFVMLESGQSFKIKVYGGVTPFDVEVLSGDAEVSFDGVNLIAKGNSKGQTNYVVRDENGVSVKGSVYVKGTRDELYKEILVEFLLDKEVFWINGEEMEIDAGTPVKPVLNEDGRTLIPIRAFIESVGGIVGWNAENREVIISLNGNVLNLILDESTAYFNGEAFEMDTQPTIVNNRTMVPLRFVSEKLGFDVNWVASKRKINIEALSRIQNLEYLQLNGNHINYGYVVSDDDYLFYLDKSEEDYNLVRKNRDNGDVGVIFEGDANYLSLHQEYLYFRDESSRLFRINKDGSNLQLVIDTPINEYFIVEDKLFFTAGVIDESLIEDSSSSDFNTLLYSVDLRNNDASPELLYARDVWDLNTDGSYLYFRHLMQAQSEEGIYRIRFDGSDFTKVMDDFVYMYILRDDEVFYLDSDWGLKKFSLSDGKQKQLIDGNVYSFNISKNHIAYLSLDDNSIYVSDLYGRDKRKIRGVPERTIVDLNFLDDSLFVFFDFSASHTTARMDNFVFDLNELYTIRPESEKFYITDDIVRQMLKEQLDEPTAGERVALIETTFGTIKMRLFDQEAPKAVENFIALSNQGYYDGVNFHRIFDDFLIQTGDPKGDGTGGESVWGEVFQDEIHPGRLNLRGAVSMANMGPNTNGSQFFIVQKPEVEEFITEQMETIGYESYVIDKYKDVGGAPWLDGTHTVFGQVFKGLDVVDEIASVNMIDAEQGIPKDEINIKSVEFKIW